MPGGNMLQAMIDDVRDSEGGALDFSGVGVTLSQLNISGGEGEPEGGGGITFEGVTLDDGAVSADVIQEATADAGVTVEGVLLKDSYIMHADLQLRSTNEINIMIGSASLLAMDDAAITGNAAAATVDGISAFVETQDGGTAAADAHGKAGGSLTITAGAGSAGGAHTANNPNGGASGNIRLVTQAGGAAGAGGAGVAGKTGTVGVTGILAESQAAPSAKTTSATLTIADLATKIITVTHSAGANQDYTLPTGTLCDAGVNLAADEGFAWSLINLSGTPATNTATILAGTGHTVVGNMVVGDQTPSGLFFTRKTGANTFVTYRLC